MYLTSTELQSLVLYDITFSAASTRRIHNVLYAQCIRYIVIEICLCVELADVQLWLNLWQTDQKIRVWPK